MKEVYLLSVHHWQQSLSIGCAVLSSPGREVYFIDPQQIEQEVEALSILSERLPVEFVDTTGSTQTAEALKTAGINFRSFFMADGHSWQEIVDHFGLPKGLCLADAASPSSCLKAASAAVRLGYNFMALENVRQLEGAVFKSLPLVWFGSRSGLPDLTGDSADLKFDFIENDLEALEYLKKTGCPVDYLVILNSSDLIRENRRSDCLGKLWVKGLSLHALTLASYRHSFVFDAAADNPDPRLIEEQANMMVRTSEMKPRFLAVLASPAAVPFFYEEKKAIVAWTEEMIRDIHIRLNDDLFYDLSEGRLMQNLPGGLSAQLISTKHYPDILKRSNRSGRDLLITGAPHVDTGIIFCSDQSLMEAQLLPLLEEAGCRVKITEGRESHYRKVSAALKDADFYLYTGHGGAEGLHTHGKALNRDDLPSLPPLVAYTSACSTVALVPHWFSSSEGLEWQGIAVDSRQVIGLAFVEKGALCFIGGATVEDLQYSTSIYSIFIEALLIKGLSVGEAVRETRHFISLFAAILLQKEPEAYRKYRWGTANAIHQQVLIGDPAFTPVTRAADAPRMPSRQKEVSPAITRVEVEIPEERWQRKITAVNDKDASKSYYRCRSIEVNTPYGENVISWGDYYRIAPDAENISETAVMSSFLHMTVDLPAGTIPKELKLIRAESADSVCLLCDTVLEPGEEAINAVSRFKQPYLLQPPLELDMRDGWAFSAEQLDGFLRLHWLAPLLLIDEKKRTARRVKKLVFEVESTFAEKVEGRVDAPTGGHSYLVCSGVEAAIADQKKDDQEPLLKAPLFAMTAKDGSFNIDLAPGAVLTVKEQFPLYELLENYNGFRKELYSVDPGKPVNLKVAPSEKVRLTGLLLDKIDGEGLEGALIRVFRAEADPVGDSLIEAFAGECLAGPNGGFHLDLSAGKYMLYAAGRVNGRRYKSSEWAIEPRAGEDFVKIFALDQAAVVRGKVLFKGDIPPDPPAVALKRFPKVDGEGVLTKVPVDRDGSFECLVSFQDRFSIVIEEEGWQPVMDSNAEKGYKLKPQEILERDFLLVPLTEEQER